MIALFPSLQLLCFPLGSISFMEGYEVAEVGTEFVLSSKVVHD